MTGYELTRQWWDFAFENTDKVSTRHSALYMWIVEKNNRLGWSKNFGLPFDEAGVAIGIIRKQTVREALNDLISWGFVKMIHRSENQNRANVISIQDCEVKSDGSLDRMFRLNNSCLTDRSTDHLADRSTEGSPDRSTEGSPDRSTGVHLNKPQTSNLKQDEDVKIDLIPDFVHRNRTELAEELKDNPVFNRAPTWEDFEQIFKTDPWLRENIRMSNHFSDYEYDRAAEKFISDQKAKKKKVKSDSDVRSHFMSWAPSWRMLAGLTKNAIPQSERIYPDDPNDPVPRKVIL